MPSWSSWKAHDLCVLYQMQFLLAFEWWRQDNFRCSNCGMAKVKTKCKNRALAKVLFVTADQEDVTLTIFDDKLSVLYAIYKQQSGQDKEFSQLTEEDLTEMLLQCVSECNHNLQSEQPSSSNLLNCPLCPSYTEQNIETMQILTCQCLIHFWSSCTKY